MPDDGKLSGGLNDLEELRYLFEAAVLELRELRVSAREAQASDTMLRNVGGAILLVDLALAETLRRPK